MYYRIRKQQFIKSNDYFEINNLILMLEEKNWKIKNVVINGRVYF